MQSDIKQINDLVAKEAVTVQCLRNEIGKVIVGQEALVNRLLNALFNANHVLIEGVPGLAKTLTVTTLARAIAATFHRIQFTPDLLPADLLGTLIYNPKEGDFTTRKGPIFANVILADEINRAPAKVQSALLESMQERQVTIGGQSYPLPEPFLVMATQNPVEQEGTYPLPEAQVDRFMFKLVVDYPSPADELRILRRASASDANLTAEAAPVISPEDVARIRRLANQVFMDAKVEEYIVSLVDCTRHPEKYRLDGLKGMLRYGASPRATLFLAMGARVNALMEGRGFTTPQDVKAVAGDVLRHRVMLTYEGEAEELTPDAVVAQVLDAVPVS